MVHPGKQTSPHRRAWIAAVPLVLSAGSAPEGPRAGMIDDLVAEGRSVIELMCVECHDGSDEPPP